MAATTRRLVLHVGMPKTGSSALQVALVQNREALLARGLHYPAAPNDVTARDHGIVNGNAGALRSYLRDQPNQQDQPSEQDDERAAAGRALVEAALAEGHRVTLFSSELMWDAPPERLTRVREWAEQNGAGLEVVLYVRDVLPQLVAHWLQQVKRHGFDGPLEAFLDSVGPRPGSRLQGRIDRFADLLAPGGLRVLHYDTHRERLLESLLGDALGLGGDLGALATPGTVNRTLTRAELGWMRAINRTAPAPRLAVAISDALVARAPLAAAPVAASPAAAARVEALFGSAVAAINERHFAGRPVLSVLGDQLIADAGEPADAEPPAGERHLLAVMGDAVQRAQVALARERRERRALETRVAELERRLATDVQHPDQHPAQRARRPRGWLGRRR